jgi:hypothetical protein
MNQHAAAFAYALPNESASFTVAVMFILLYMVFAGAIATPDVIPEWLKWMYWINPQAWCYQALAINEFRASKYDGDMVNGTRVCNYGGQLIPGRCGDFFLENRQFKTSEFYLWGAFVLTGVWILITFMIQCYALNYLKYEKPKTTIDGDDDEEEAMSPTLDGSEEKHQSTDCWQSQMRLKNFASPVKQQPSASETLHTRCQLAMTQLSGTTF